MLDLSGLPNFCSHEHWGLIRAFPPNEYGYGVRCNYVAGAASPLKTGLLNILKPPPLAGDSATQVGQWHELPLDEARKLMQLALPVHELSGRYQCVRRGILALHGCDVTEDDGDVWARADESIARGYADYFRWVREGMEMANLSELLRPVEMEFFVQQDSAEDARVEAGYSSHVVRLEAFMSFWPAAEEKITDPATQDNLFRPLARFKRDRMAKIAGVMPHDPASWRTFIANLFDLAQSAGAVGLKQMQGYQRPLAYEPRADSDVTWTGDLSTDEIRVFQDWMMHEICKQAHERGWTHQIHAAVPNMRDSSPLPLEDLAQRYPNMKIVILHCWPFIKEAGLLAQQRHNIYLDTNWLPILSPAFFREAIATWLHFVPLHKVMCGHDAHSVEEAAGSSLFTREILAELLADQHRRLAIPESRLMQTAASLLHNNAVAFYGIGEPVS